ncbi:MAG: Asd/ArgC dimerization domain-containing protein [Gemmatimonadota bacterium]
MTGPKRARQQAILEAIAERPIGSQEELRQLLLRQGLDVTQSTLSRDLRDLRIARVPTASGVRYVVSEPASEDAQRASLAAILPQLFSSIEGVGVLVVLKTVTSGAQPVANPGCYPTSVLLALAPLIERDLIAPDAAVQIASASGVTGAGLTPRLDLLFGEVTENFRAYGVGNTHRHLNEMRACVQEMGATCDLLFTPHLLPAARGILSTITVPLRAPLDDALALYRTRYANEPFIEIADELPELRQVQRRNVVRITARPVANTRTPMLQLFSAIDNLVKGAAGQALQNANLMLGLDETLGLPR